MYHKCTDQAFAVALPFLLPQTWEMWAGRWGGAACALLEEGGPKDARVFQPPSAVTAALRPAISVVIFFFLVGGAPLTRLAELY